MNAINFIQQHGVEKAREVVEGAPEHCFVYDLERKEYVAYEDTSIAMCFLKSRFIDLSELKSLVESVALVNWHGGIKYAKPYLERNKKDHPDVLGGWQLLEQAIEDYEAIGGEHV